MTLLNPECLSNVFLFIFMFFYLVPFLLYVYTGVVLNSTKEYEMRVLATLTAFLGCLFLFGAVFGHGDLGEPVVRSVVRNERFPVFILVTFYLEFEQ